MTPNKLVCFLITTSVIILMTSQGSSGVKQVDKSEPCAACRYQRHRCPADCIFRLFFPGDRHQDFRNIHRLYSLRNLKFMLGRMTPELRGDGIKSIIYGANLWSRFPGQGCSQLIRLLQNQIALVTAELGRTRTQIAAAASNPAAAAVSNPAAANPTAINFFYPPTANFFDPAAFNFFTPSTAVESELINPFPTLVANNDAFARVIPVSDDDGRIDFLSGGGQCRNIAYEEECVIEPETSATANNNDVQQSIPNLNINLGTRPGPADDFDFVAGLEASGVAPPNDVQQSIPNPNNLGSSPGPLDDFDFVAGLEASGGVPPNDDPLRDFDFGFTDAERSFYGIQDSGDKCGSADKSLTKDDDFPFP